MEKIVVFDGYCNFCSAWVKLGLKADKERELKYAASQSDAGKALIRKHHLDEVDKTIYLIEGNEVYDRSSAIFHIINILGFPYNIFLIMGIFGRPINDGLYKLVSIYRFQIFGKRQTCFVPSPEMKMQFMD